MKRILGAVCGLLLGLVLLSGLPQPVFAGPVDWQEVPVTSEGQQWWDRGSLRLNKNGNLTVLSRFQPRPRRRVPMARRSAPRPAAST
ncbi:hypothetical protein [Synechococcus sp. CB0205]|uniref:hypothetical protein n=1 Tax=Synechococcus sp. CB0205 TaxID=232363 RepID=UPI00031EEA96